MHEINIFVKNKKQIVKTEATKVITYFMPIEEIEKRYGCDDKEIRIYPRYHTAYRKQIDRVFKNAKNDMNKGIGGRYLSPLYNRRYY